MFILLDKSRDLGIEEWLDFSVSLVGVVIGGIITALSLYIIINDSDKKFDYEKHKRISRESEEF